MDLTAEQYEQALGIAAVLMAVPNSLVHFTMSNIYHYQHGFCAQDGVLSAMLAEHGVDGMTAPPSFRTGDRMVPKGSGHPLSDYGYAPEALAHQHVGSGLIGYHGCFYERGRNHRRRH